jgi:hypothetical protein
LSKGIAALLSVCIAQQQSMSALRSKADIEREAAGGLAATALRSTHALSAI